MTPDCTPIVVAGGRSRRFGETDKLVAELDGRALVDRAVEAATTATGRQPVVAARDADHVRRIDAAIGTADPRYVHDDPDYVGPVAGIAAALETVETPWVFVCGGDMPWLSPAAIRTLGERADRVRPAGVVPRHEGHLEPLHGVYRVTDLNAAVEAACDRTSVRGVVERLAPLVTVPTTHADASLRRSLADVDEREDLPNQHHESTDRHDLRAVTVVGPSDAGKTTLVERMVTALSDEFRVATVKSIHHDIEPDDRGTDTHRHRTAGADAVVGVTPSFRFEVSPHPATGNHSEEAATADPDAAKRAALEDSLDRFAAREFDVVLVEGFAGAPLPTIVVGDPAECEIAGPVIATDEDGLKAVVDAVREAEPDVVTDAVRETGERAAEPGEPRA